LRIFAVLRRGEKSVDALQRFFSRKARQIKTAIELSIIRKRKMLIAITREVSSNIGNCQLTHLSRETIDINLAREQHRQYEECLKSMGCEVLSLTEEAELPDSVFVEDTAIVLDELAIITRPGAGSRRPETASIAEALTPYRQLYFLTSPATIDGGDVLRVGKNIYVGLSTRSNSAGIEQMQNILEPFGYRVTGVEVQGCLHLKSAVTQVAEDTLLINRRLLEADVFGDINYIDVDETEPLGANALWINREVIYPAGFPLTRKRLEDAGMVIRAVEVSELMKAEGAVTCCSLVFKA
jgi:dimethylargininase